EPELERPRRIGLVVGQSDYRRLSTGHEPGLQRQLPGKFVARVAPTDDEKTEVIGVVALALGGEALNRDRTLLAGIAEKSLQERKLLLDLRIFALQLERLLGQRDLHAAGHV